jgi:hypothetical protein
MLRDAVRSLIRDRESLLVPSFSQSFLKVSSAERERERERERRGGE